MHFTPNHFNEKDKLKDSKGDIYFRVFQVFQVLLIHQKYAGSKRAEQILC